MNPLNDAIIKLREHDQWLRNADKTVDKLSTRLEQVIQALNTQGAVLKRLDAENAALKQALAAANVNAKSVNVTTSQPAQEESEDKMVPGWDYSGEEDAELAS